MVSRSYHPNCRPFPPPRAEDGRTLYGRTDANFMSGGNGGILPMGDGGGILPMGEGGGILNMGEGGGILNMGEGGGILPLCAGTSTTAASWGIPHHLQHHQHPGAFNVAAGNVSNAWRAPPPRFPSRPLDGGGLATPPPPPPIASPLEDGTPGVQLRPRQNEGVDHRNQQMRLEEEFWDKERKLRGGHIPMPSGSRLSTYGGIPRRMMLGSPGMWQQPQAVHHPHRFDAGSMEPNLLMQHHQRQVGGASGHPFLMQQTRMPGLASGALGMTGGRSAARRCPNAPLQGPMLMLHQSAALRRLEATDGRYLDDSDLEGHQQPTLGSHAISSQERQEEELVEELQAFLDLELARGIRAHSFFARVADKIQEDLLTNKTKAQIDAIVPVEARFHPTSLFPEIKGRTKFHVPCDTGLIVRNIQGVHRLSSLHKQEDEEQARAPKKPKLSTPVTAEFFPPNFILSCNLSRGLKDLPFNLLDETDEQAEGEAKDEPATARQLARLQQLIASRRVQEAFTCSTSFPSPNWVVPALGVLQASRCYISRHCGCPTYPSLGAAFKKRYPDQEAAESNSNVDLMLCDTAFTFPMKNKSDHHQVEEKLLPPSCLSTAFTCILNSTNLSHLEIMSFISTAPHHSTFGRKVDNLSIERSLAQIIIQS